MMDFTPTTSIKVKQSLPADHANHVEFLQMVRTTAYELHSSFTMMVSLIQEIYMTIFMR